MGLMINSENINDLFKIVKNILITFCITVS